MDAEERRSRDVNETLTASAIEAPTDARSDATAEFEALYRSSRDDLFAYLAGILRDRAAAEEITAQAFERAFRRRRSFNPKRGTRRAWLFGIARNAALDELRRRGRQATLAAEPEDEHAGSAAEEAAEASLRRTTVRAAIARLSGRDRELIALKYFAGLANSEIAAVVGISESNAGTRVHRVIEKLREECDEG
jgi:RNA polymerase sigma-70 factor (ECF subfamily)